MSLNDSRVQQLLENAETVESATSGAWVSVPASDVIALCGEVLGGRKIKPAEAGEDHPIGGQGGGIDPNPPLEASASAVAPTTGGGGGGPAPIEPANDG